MKEKIKFQDLLARCEEYLNNTITQEELAEATKSLFVRYYIPMKEKIEIIQDILYESYFIMEPIELRIKGIEISKILKGFLAYFGNIDYTTDDKKLIDECDEATYEIINLVLYVGSPELVKVFERDYEQLCRMLDNIVAQGDINNLFNVFRSLDMETLKKENDKFRRSFKDITKTEEGQRVVKDLLEIARFNDPTTKKIIENETIESLKNNK